MSSSVKLYVYDLSNGLARQLSPSLMGRQMDGVWHTSVVVFGKEIFYGQGISITEPGKSHHGTPLRILDMGYTAIDEDTFSEYIEGIRAHYTAEKYHLLDFNCNVFTNDCIGFLTGGSIPSYITSLPRDFLETPFGAALRPRIDAMFAGRSTPAAANLPQQPAAAQATGPIHATTTAASFESVLRTHRAVVAFFTSATCGPCRMIEPVFEDLARSKARPGVAFAKVDLGLGGGAVASAYNIRATPTFLFFLEGAKTHELRGANAPELKTQVELLIYEAYPPHAHARLVLPALDALLLDPILYSQVPNLDVMFAKLAGFVDGATTWTGGVTRAQAKAMLSERVLPFLRGVRGGGFEPWVALTTALAANLGAGELFPLVDMVRLALLDAEFAAWAASSGVLWGLVQTGPRSYVLTLLRMLANAFSNRDLAGAVVVRVRGVLVDALLHTDAGVRTAAASVGFNIGAYVQRVGRLGEEEETEVIVAVLGAIEREKNEETLHRLVACLGLLLRLSPHTEQLGPLLETLRAREMLRGIECRPGVRRLVIEVDLIDPDDAEHLFQMSRSYSNMLRFQASLPRLPVPPLGSTIAKYLDTVRPHLSDAEFASTRDNAHAFLRSPLAAELQRRLEARAADPDTKNWLADWWNESAYMGYRDPVVVFVSYFYVHVDDRRSADPAGRAARLIKALLAFRSLTESGQLEPETVRGQPLCMDSYKWLFHACRYPAKPCDTARKYDPHTHDHVVFVRKNRFFEVPLSVGGRPLSAAELQLQVERVIAAAVDEGVPVGALTGENRDVWTEAREALLAASPINGQSLSRIESAAIVVCLDEAQPITCRDISWACWVGDGRNRFYDKHQLIVFDNGRSGFLGEHSCMDGTSTLRMNEFMLASLAANKIDLGPARTALTGANLAGPTELRFELDARCQGYVDEACKHFDALVGQEEMEVVHYEGYGKDVMKQFKVSPDAWVQLVKQLAFHKMYNRPGVTYESCQTRKYQLGRTEVIRSASNESKAWAEAMLNPDATDAERAALFRRAVDRHLEYAGWASEGQGVDRHLFGLKRLLRAGEETPGIYSDAGYRMSGHWELSTSQLSSEYVDGWGYGQVVPDGFGLSYAIGSDYVRWTITCMKGHGSGVLGHFLAEAATETRRMMAGR